jgi:hypothetical protein
MIPLQPLQKLVRLSTIVYSLMASPNESARQILNAISFSAKTRAVPLQFKHGVLRKQVLPSPDSNPELERELAPFVEQARARARARDVQINEKSELLNLRSFEFKGKKRVWR